MFEAIDKAFASWPRPAKFTDHPFCEECAEANDFFEGQTIETLGAMDYESEIVPVVFLTEPAFMYFFPAIARMMTHGDLVVLLHLTELKLNLFDEQQAAALRDFLYGLNVEGKWMGPETVERIIDRLESGAA